MKALRPARLALALFLIVAGQVFRPACGCLGGASVYAQDQTKPPPPPLFPRHRRGLYKNNQGIEVVSATPQSPPLETDDPGVPEKGAYEINFTAAANLSKDTQSLELVRVDANYGLQPKIAGHELPTQVKVEFPVTAARESGNPFSYGIGAATVGLKFNVYNDEQKGLFVSVYPQWEFGEREFVLPLLVAREFKYLTVVTNVGFDKPFQDPDGNLTGTFGFGIGRAITRKVAAMLELRGESTFDFSDDRQVLVNFGVFHGAGNVVVYAKVGHSLFQEDGIGHTYLGVGVKILSGQ